MKTVTASDANRKFSKILQEVGRGEVFTIVSRGKPVATIMPARSGASEHEAAKQRLMDRLRSQKSTGARDWSRDELYERGR